MADQVTVRYTGKRYAVLAGRAIQSGQTRVIARSQLEEALRYHPGEFEIVGEKPAFKPIETVSVPGTEPVEKPALPEVPEKRSKKKS